MMGTITKRLTLWACFTLFLLIDTQAQPYLVGYWQNWNDAAAPYIPLDQIDSRYNVVNLSFAIPGGGTDYDMEFNLCCGETQAGLLSKIQSLQAAGIIVNISIGGATAPIHLDNATEKNTFISSMNTIINTYGFDGLDIDLEGASLSVSAGSTIAAPTDAAVVNMIDAVQQIATDYQANFGKKMFLSAAPETAFVQGGMSNWGGIWGAYLPLLDALRNDMDLLHVQLYNSGSMYGIDGNTYTQGTADFIVSQTEAVIQGFTTVGMGGLFAGFPASKVAVGLPACPSAAGGGFTDVATVKSAIDYLMGNGTQPGSYILQAGPYPDLAGMMTWSINWDAVSTCNTSAYEYAANYEDIFLSGTCWVPSLGADVSSCGLSFPHILNSGTTVNTDVTFTWTNLSTGQVLVSNDPAANTLGVSAEGIYQVRRDSASCVKFSTMAIVNDLATPDIGGDQNLCNIVPISLSIGNSGAFPGGAAFQWHKDGTPLSGETGTSLGDIRIAGLYKVVATHLNCSKGTEINVTSDLPEPVDGCGAPSTSIALSILPNGTGPYEWYDAPTTGSLLTTGENYLTPALGSTTTYYVEDKGALGNATTGPSVTPAGMGGLGNWQQPTEIIFDALGSFTLKEVTIYPLIYCFTHTVSFEVRNSSDVVLANGSQSFSVTDDADCGTLIPAVTLTLSGGGVSIPAGMGYKLVSTGSIGFDHWTAPSFPMDYSPYFQITGSNVANTYMAVHDWVVEGGGCERMPVVATVSGTCGILPVEMLSFTAREEGGIALLDWETVWEENNFYFEIQKSEDGISFEKIGVVFSQGGDGAAYQYKDDAVRQGGVYYYRLKQVDDDRNYAFSEIVTLSFPFRESSISLYPNPVGETLHLNLQENIQGTMEVFDNLGRRVIGPLALTESLEVGALANGLYRLRIRQGQGRVEVLVFGKGR